MAYRFTNTEKWADSWFSTLKQLEMLLFIYLCDNCDIAGFIEVNYKRWATDINTTIDKVQMAIIGLNKGLLISKNNDCIFIRNFLKHQKNLPLIPEKNPAHKGIINRFNEYKHKFDIEDINDFFKRGLIGANEGLGSPLGNGNSNGKYQKDDAISKIPDLEFKTEKIKEIWHKWIQYKKEQFNDTYKSERSELTAFNQLRTLSKGNHTIAEKIVDRSIANLWKGLFRLDDKENEKDPNKRELYR